MLKTHYSPKPDPFVVLILLVSIGVSITVAFQLRMYNIEHFLNTRSAQNVAPIPWQSDQIAVTISDFRQR